MTQFAELSAPFAAKEIDWRPGATNQDKTKALALAYLSARPIMDRLDEVMGPVNWRDSYHTGPQGGVICRLELRFDGEWIAKEDGADNSEMEAVKGGLSDAFKRAAVKWGIGRYLYDLPNVWHPCEAYGKTIKLTGVPQLPKWALPAGDKSTGRTVDVETGEIKLPPFPPETPATPPADVPPWVEPFNAMRKEQGISYGLIGEVIGARASITAIGEWLAADTERSWQRLLSEAADRGAVGAR